MAKTYASTYLYSAYNQYEQQTIDFLMKADRILKDGPGFEDITYEIKRRQVSPALVKVLMSPNVVLMSSAKPLSKAFKVFCAKDIKNDSNLKVFIDVSGIIKMDDKSGKYVCDRNNIDIFISFLINAMTTFIYYSPKGTDRLTNNTKMKTIGCRAFAELYTHIVDYLCKITTLGGVKDKCKFLSGMYFLTNIMGMNVNSDSTKAIAIKNSNISDREAEVLLMQLDENAFLNIKFFTENLAKVLHLNKFTLDTLTEKWMYVYGTGTVFALELFPPFAAMLTDAYVGAYVNNQKTIEKIAAQSMVEFTKEILRIGAESV